MPKRRVLQTRTIHRRMHALQCKTFCRRAHQIRQRKGLLLYMLLTRQSQNIYRTESVSARGFFLLQARLSSLRVRFLERPSHLAYRRPLRRLAADSALNSFLYPPPSCSSCRLQVNFLHVVFTGCKRQNIYF